MIKAINVTGWSLLLVALLLAEKASPVLILALAAASLGLIWLGHALHREVLHHQYQVQDAPIATAVARDLNIRV